MLNRWTRRGVGHWLLMLLIGAALLSRCVSARGQTADERFEALAERYLDEFPALVPVAATLLGDHRFDDQLDEVTDQARTEQLEFCRRYLRELAELDRAQLSRPHQVDYSLLDHELRAQQWRHERLREWAWNPLQYTQLTGDAIYGLVAREYAPVAERLRDVAVRLEKMPRLLGQIRQTLVPALVPAIHAKTAVDQNRGMLSTIDNMVRPQLEALDAEQRSRLVAAIAVAEQAIDEHQQWLETVLVPNAAGNFRIGADLYDQRLAFTLHTPLSRHDVRERAEQELVRVRDEMYAISKAVYVAEYPYTRLPENPTKAYQQAIIRAALEIAYLDRPAADKVVEAAQASLQLALDFVHEKELVTVPPDPVEIIIMPEFRRGVSLAYCDSPGPLDVGQKTFYAVAPLPSDWNSKQIQSFLREYNTRSVHNLTIHEAVPGHFLQLAHSNRYQGRLRSVLTSGTFVEGWAVYTEQMMTEQGFLNGDPLMKLIALKWYLRGIANAMIDQAIHCDNMSREAALQLMIEDTFQEEREAAAKWVRAQLTSAQLATYFVGYLEHSDLRREAEQRWQSAFRLKDYHDRVLSFGSPPVMHVRALLLDEEIP